MPVTPYYELHIRPMFRIIDRDHMLYKFDLYDYDKVVKVAGDILKRVSQIRDMPPTDSGGPWPDEWIALFKRWIECDFPRLALPTKVDYTLGSNAVLTAEGDTPDGGDVWFDRNNMNESPREYTLVLRPAKTGEPTAFGTEEKLPKGTTSVVVFDGDGRHEIKR